MTLFSLHSRRAGTSLWITISVGLKNDGHRRIDTEGARPACHLRPDMIRRADDTQTMPALFTLILDHVCGSRTCVIVGKPNPKPVPPCRFFFYGGPDFSRAIPVRISEHF